MTNGSGPSISKPPDGAIYGGLVRRQVNHYRNHEGEMDKNNGRVYRLKAKGAKPIKSFDLAKSSADDSIGLLRRPNKWFRQEALRLLGDRPNPSLAPRLIRIIETNSGPAALEALWALHLSGAFHDNAALQFLDHKNPQVRLWTVRLAGDKPPGALGELAATAKWPGSSLTSKSASNWPAPPNGSQPSRAPIVQLLTRDEDADRACHF